MRRFRWIALIAVFSMLATTPAALAEKRVALVIGNSGYQHTPKLANPKNDASDMAAALKKHGFQVIEGLDLDKPAFDRKVRDFAAALKGSDAGMFFYAGHGLQVAGQNYLVPIDARAEDVDALEFEMVRVDTVHRIMERQTNTNILFLDACRDNPLARNLARAMGTRSAEIGRGLASVESGVGTLISFSTQPGNVALDGTGRNSPFAGALVKHLVAPKEDLSAILIDVRNDVRKETQNKQVPWEHSALTGRFYFNPIAPAAVPAIVAPARLSEAAEAWGVAERTNTILALEAFIRRFGDTYYGDLAKVRLAELKQAEAAKQAADAAKKKADEDAHAERQRLALLQQEEERKRAEAAKKADEDARAKADAERQRLALLQQEQERKRAEAEAARKRAEAAEATNAGRVFRDCPDCPEMVVVPAGSFMMGSPASEPERESWQKGIESPQLKVTIALAFAVGKFAVTFDEWDACVAGGGCNGYRPGDQGWGRGKRPVINVNWDDAKAYASWLSRKAGKTYRLLSEAEREYVTRADTTTPFWWGSSISPTQANYLSSAAPYRGGGSKGDYRQRTVPVDSFAANPWSLYNVHGNVWEWTEDCWNDSHAGNLGDGSPWTTGDCDRRVLRGGSWGDDPQYLRAASRIRYITGGRYSNRGFRLARMLSP